ncbi:hypothetical protein [Brevibacillus borstelensis]|uniref:hypothetical protein n=1 Tax=Brevibacillus borstelensis TaxID=45462 RepID=UPI0030C3492B
MYRKAYLQIWWGLLFLLLSFHVQGIDLLPDLVGYFLLFLGLRTLAAQHPQFWIVIYFAAASVVYRGVLKILLSGSDEGNPLTSYAMTLFLENIQGVFHFLTLYALYQAIRSVAQNQGCFAFSQKVEGAQRALLSVFLAMAFASPFLPHFEAGVAALLFVLQLIFFFICLYSLILVRLAARQLAH